MLTKIKIEEILKECQPFIKEKFKVSQIGIFGSFVRNEATENSDIRFYNLPNTKADFMAANGSVLDMRNLSWPVFEEYTPYNK